MANYTGITTLINFKVGSIISNADRQSVELIKYTFESKHPCKTHLLQLLDKHTLSNSCNSGYVAQLFSVGFVAMDEWMDWKLWWLCHWFLMLHVLSSPQCRHQHSTIIFKESFITVTQTSLKWSSLPLESDSSEAMWLESPVSGRRRRTMRD